MCTSYFLNQRQKKKMELTFTEYHNIHGIILVRSRNVREGCNDGTLALKIAYSLVGENKISAR